MNSANSGGHKTTILLFLASILGVVSAAYAQQNQNATLSIIVMDGQRAVVPSARVTIYPNGTSPPQLGFTDERGSYIVPLPSAGPILIQVEREGFRKNSRMVSLQSGHNVSEEFLLDVSGIDANVVVTAADAPQTVDQITKALTVVTSQEINDRDEYSLAGILSAVPGFQVHNVGGPGQLSTLRVRGLRTDSAAVLIDGMRFRDAATAQGDSSSFLSNLNFIAPDRVEVLRGSGSSLYGTNAASGVVNIVSDPGGGVAHGTFQAEGGNLGFLRGRTQLGGGALHDRLKYSGGIVHLNVMRGVDGNDRTRSTGVQSFARFDFAPGTIFTGRFFGSDDFVQSNITPTATGIPAANIPGVVVPAIALLPDQVLRLQNGQTPAYGTATFIPGRDDPDSRRASRFYSTAFRLQQSFLNAVNVQASYQRVHTNRIFINGPAGSGSQPAVPNYSRFLGAIDTIDVRGNANLSAWNQLTAGYEFEREHYADVQDNNLPAAQRIRTETAIRQNANAIYAANQSSLLHNRLQLSISGRVQTFTLRKPDFKATGVTNNYDRIALTAPPKARTADLSLSYFLQSSGTKLRAHGGNAYRAPGLFERFGAGFFLNATSGLLVFSPYGDPFLAPDRYNSIDGGVDQYLWRDRARLSSTYFYTRVATITAFDSGTVIKAATDPYGRTSGYINGSGGLSRGLELSVEARPAGQLTLRGAYSYTNAVMDKDITVPGFWRVLGVPRHSLNVVVTERIGHRATVAFDFVKNSEMYGNFTAAGRARAYRYAGYAKADVSGSYEVRQNDRHALKLTLRVDNIFNRTIYDLGWLAPRAAFVMGLSFQF